MSVRVGVHLADVVRDDEGVYGTGVNVAARVQALCPPGGVLVSGPVSRELQNQAGVDVVCVGYYRIKNIDPPLELCAVADPALAMPEARDIEAPHVPWSEPPRCGDDALPGSRRRSMRARLAAFGREARRRRVDRVMTAYVTAVRRPRPGRAEGRSPQPRGEPSRSPSSGSSRAPFSSQTAKVDSLAP